MQCWNCGATETAPSFGKISFRATCEKCAAALHCCCNCIYYKPGQPNDCAIPGTDSISDRTATNFCEDFKLLGQYTGKNKDADRVAKRLFGINEEDKESDPKKRFNSLFGD